MATIIEQLQQRGMSTEIVVDLRGSKSPGPGARPSLASLSTAPMLPRTVFGGGMRFPPQKSGNLVPGPGAYPLPPPHIRSFTLAGREHVPNYEEHSAPGVGSYPRYDTATTRRRNAPSFTLRGKRTPRVRVTQSPAPNAHQPVRHAGAREPESQRSSLRTIEFGKYSSTRPTAMPHWTSTIEGIYDVGPAEALIRPAAPSYSIASRREPPRKFGVAEPEFHKPLEAFGPRQPLFRTTPAPSLKGRTSFVAPVVPHKF